MPNEFEADLITVVDEEGKEHRFELVDAIETDDGRYVALIPSFDDPQDAVDDDGELIILAVEEDEDGETLCPIESDEMFDNVAAIFEERLADLFEVEEMERPEE